MKLIEKKCPNCGASLEFSDTDKSCKCSYCHRAFEIEREQDNSNEKSLEQQYTLNEIPTSLKLIPIIVFLFVFVVALSIFGIVFSQVSSSDGHDKVNSFEINDKDDGNSLYSSVDELTNSDFESIDNDSIFAIKSTAEGVNDAYHSYSKDGDAKRQKVYVAYKEGTNSIIAIYQVTFKDFFHQENRYTVYVPIVYENISKEKFGDKFENPQVKAPEYYFNDDHSSFSYGYSSMEEAYQNVVKPLEDQEYKITEK